LRVAFDTDVTDDMAHAMRARELEKRFDRSLRPQTRDFSAEVPRALFVFQEMTLQCRVDSMTGFLFGLHMNREPIRVEPAS
jgi:hypothetical protein